MFIFAHIGITAFFAALFSLSPLTAAIASQIPDLIDKILYFIGITPVARYVGHTLLSVFVFGLISYVITKKKIFSLSISFGILMHLIEDYISVLVNNSALIPWFFPFVKYNFVIEPWIFHYNKFLFITDTLGVLAILILWLKSKTFRKEIYSFLNYIKSYVKKSNI